jgi:hypothetical protein
MGNPCKFTINGGLMGKVSINHGFPMPIAGG